jgi:hypothetical protein
LAVAAGTIVTATTVDLEISASPIASAAWDDDSEPLRRHARPRSFPAWLDNQLASNDVMWSRGESLPKRATGTILHRLRELDAMLFAEEGVRIDQRSSQTLLRLFVCRPTLRAPSVSVQPDGVLIATWVSPDGERLAVRCSGGEAGAHFSMMGSVQAGGVRAHQWGNMPNPAAFWDDNPQARRIAS